ncbi:polycystin-1-like protein 3 [Lampetra planeri]
MNSTVCVVGGGNKATTTNAGRERVFIAAEVLAPNTIDFSTVFTKFDLVSNGAVFAAVIVIILLYLIMLLWARKADIKDNEKNRMFQLFNADDENRRSLVLRVVTASTKDAGTRSCVCFTLYFDEIDSGTHELTHPELKEFETGSTNNFLFSVPKYYGKPSHIKLWLNDGDPCDFWTINEISVLDLEKNQVYLFCVNSMLSYEMNIGQYGRRFDVKEERFSFGNKWMVHHALKGNFSEGHLWFSVFIRPFKTNFSRVQRISCCVTLLFLMMIANAMWFGKKQAANGAGGGVTVGPLSLIDVLISLLSSLVEVPVSLVVVLIFRNSRSESERSPGQKSSWRGPWPGGCRCVAWCLVVLAVLSSGFFTILYSMEWGPEKANRWLVRFLSSFFISVILVQPVKNLVFAMGKCLLWKRNTKCQAEEILKPYAENHEIMNNTNAEQDSVVHVKETSNFAHPTKWQSCFDLRTIFLSLYLTVLLFAAYIHSGSCAIYFKYNIEKTFTRQFEKTADVASYWNWVSGSLLPHMKATSSSSVAASGGTLHNTVLANVLVVGVVQMRQLRYKKAPSEMNYVKMLQNGQYTAPEEDKNSYFEAWVMSNITGRSEGDQYWIYQDLGEMDLSRTLGQFGGGGYLVEVENDAGKAANTVAYLKENLWIDPRTAELVTELTLFNANTRLLCHLILHLVLSPSGELHMTLSLDQTFFM